MLMIKTNLSNTILFYQIMPLYTNKKNTSQRVFCSHIRLILVILACAELVSGAQDPSSYDPSRASSRWLAVSS